MRNGKQALHSCGGVERGFYVYAHRDSHTNGVFYVGMGRGRRVWDKKSRPEGWTEKVASLQGAWKVEILKNDLSELEAFQLEHKRK